MNCLHYKNELMETVRERAELKPELSKHLMNCILCREFFESQKRLSVALNALKNTDSNEKPNDSLQQRLITEMQSQRSRPYFWLQAAAVFVISVLCGSLWIYQKEYRQNPIEKTQRSARENWNDYVPLTYGMAPGETLQKFRVKLPRSALNDFGIAVKEARTEEVTADVIVGESGVPYAIRVVQQSN